MSKRLTDTELRSVWAQFAASAVAGGEAAQNDNTTTHETVERAERIACGLMERFKARFEPKSDAEFAVWVRSDDEVGSDGCYIRNDEELSYCDKSDSRFDIISLRSTVHYLMANNAVHNVEVRVERHGVVAPPPAEPVPHFRLWVRQRTIVGEIKGYLTESGELSSGLAEEGKLFTLDQVKDTLPTCSYYGCELVEVRLYPAGC